jgi:hypothetical protein
MVTFLLRTIDISSAWPIQKQIYQLGGRHAIYGVTVSDFEKFAECFGKVLEKYIPNIAQENKIDPQSFDIPALMAAWQKTLQGFGSVMVQAGLPSQQGFCATIYVYTGERKEEWNKTKKDSKGDSTWKKYFGKLTLTSLLLYRDSAMTQLKAQYPIGNVNAVTFPNLSESRFVFELICPKTPFLLTLSVREEAEFTEWIEELNWRILAHHRAAVPEEEDLDDVVNTVNSRKHKDKKISMKKQDSFSLKSVLRGKV